MEQFIKILCFIGAICILICLFWLCPFSNYGNNYTDSVHEVNNDTEICLSGAFSHDTRRFHTLKY